MVCFSVYWSTWSSKLWSVNVRVGIIIQLPGKLTEGYTTWSLLSYYSPWFPVKTFMAIIFVILREFSLLTSANWLSSTICFIFWVEFVLLYMNYTNIWHENTRSAGGKFVALTLSGCFSSQLQLSGFFLELYSDSDVESDISSEDLIEDLPHHRRRKSLGQTVDKDKPQPRDGLHESKC